MYDFQSKMYNINGMPEAGSWSQLRPANDPVYFTSRALKRTGIR